MPVYGTAFTMGILEGKLREHDLWSPKHMHVVEDFARLKVGRGELQAEWIPVTHSIPDACGIALHTPWGVVVHTGDYKLDPTPVDGRLTGTDRLIELGDQGVKVLLSDSTNILNTKPTPSEELCREGLRDAFRTTKGKLFVATFSSNIHRIQTLLDLAYEEKRKVCLLGRSIERNTAVARSLKRLSPQDDLFIEPKEVSFRPQAGGGSLHRLPGRGHERPHPRPQGRGQGHQDGGWRPAGAQFPVHPGQRGGHFPDPGHRGAAGRGDHRGRAGPGPRHGPRPPRRFRRDDPHGAPGIMAPVHGTYRNLKVHGQLAESLGHPKDRVLLLDGGECLQLAQGRRQAGRQRPRGQVFRGPGRRPHGGRKGHPRPADPAGGRHRRRHPPGGPRHRGPGRRPQHPSRGFVVLSDDQAYQDLLRATVRTTFENAPGDPQGPGPPHRIAAPVAAPDHPQTTQTRPVVVPMILDAMPSLETN